MTTNHIDQLDKWYEEAEKGTPRVGDLFISPYPSGVGYEVGVMDEDGLPGNMLLATRILARAPKPKPAWHDAVAVMAVTPGRPERRVFIRDDEPGWWGDADSSYETDELAHVTPLIEAKVTDAMRDRVRDYYRTEHQVELPRGDAWLNDLLTVALGLETA